MNLKWRITKSFYRFDPPVSCLRKVVKHFLDDAREDYESVPPERRDMHHVYLDLLVMRDWLDDKCEWREMQPMWQRRPTTRRGADDATPHSVDTRIIYDVALQEVLEEWAAEMRIAPQELLKATERAIRLCRSEATPVPNHPNVLRLWAKSFSVYFTVEATSIVVRGYTWEPYDDLLGEHGGIFILAHPEWSDTTTGLHPQPEEHD